MQGKKPTGWFCCNFRKADRFLKWEDLCPAVLIDDWGWVQPSDFWNPCYMCYKANRIPTLVNACSEKSESSVSFCSYYQTSSLTDYIFSEPILHTQHINVCIKSWSTPDSYQTTPDEESSNMSTANCLLCKSETYSSPTGGGFLKSTIQLLT